MTSNNSGATVFASRVVGETLSITAGADGVINTKDNGQLFWTGNQAFSEWNASNRVAGPANVTYFDGGGTLCQTQFTWQVFFDNSSTNPGIYTPSGCGGSGGTNVTLQDTTNTGYDQNKFHQDARSWVEALSTTSVKFTSTEGTTNQTKRVALIRGAVEGEAGESVYTVASGETLPKTLTADVRVTELTCTAESVAGGVKQGNVPADLVITDGSSPRGNAVVIGGHMVNRLAVGVTDGSLLSAGDKYLDRTGNTVYAAGYTAEDTVAVVDELVAAIKAL
jgi:hypothetical protein